MPPPPTKKRSPAPEKQGPVAAPQRFYKTKETRFCVLGYGRRGVFAREQGMGCKCLFDKAVREA